MLHNTDFKNAELCGRLAWLHQHEPKPPVFHIHLEKPWSWYWKRALGLENAPSLHIGASAEETLEALKHAEAICEARFTIGEYRVRIPALLRSGEGYEAVFPYLTTTLREKELPYLKASVEAARAWGVNINKVSLLYLNRQYVLEGELDFDRLFIRTDRYASQRDPQTGRTIIEQLDELEIPLAEWIEQSGKLIHQAEPEPACLQSACLTKRGCPYLEECFDYTKIPDDSPLFLNSYSHKIQAYQEGIEHIKDLELPSPSGMQKAQLEASRTGKPHVDVPALQEWFKDVRHPYSFLDFEWDLYGVPAYEGLKPHEVICFQYSLHKEGEQGMEHVSFFEPGDCRQAFIEKLLTDIPEEGTIFVYNMEGAEKLRLKQLARQFPQYRERLEAVWNRMKDLSKPFERGLYYDNRQRGHYSLKALLPLFTDEVSYQQLEVQNGVSAVEEYRRYASNSPENQQRIRQELEVYCALDTWSEIVLVAGLARLAGREDLCPIL